MFHYKKLISMIIGMLMVSGVAGCGKSGTDSNKGNIKIGLNLELSGSVAEYGAKGQNGALLAIENINKKGGILGKQIEAVTMDNKSDNSEAASIAAKLAQSGIAGYVGCMTTGKSLSAIPIVTQNKIPMVSPAATAADVTVDSKTGMVRENVFRVCFLDPFQGQIMAKFAGTVLKSRNAAIMLDNSNDYSKGLAASFEKAFVAAGGRIVVKEAYVEKDKDFKSTLTKIRAAKPDVIFVPGYYNEAGLIVKQGRELGITVPFIGGDGWGSPQLLQIAGASALNNTFFCNHFSAASTDPKVQAFVKEYKDKYGSEPDGFAALGYDAALLLMDAIARAGSTDAARITQALASTAGLPGVAGAITMDKNHNPVKSAVIISYNNGKEIVAATIQP